MAIQFRCNCGKLLKVSDDTAGKNCRCPNCDRVLTIPKSSQDAPIQAAVIAKPAKPSTPAPPTKPITPVASRPSPKPIASEPPKLNDPFGTASQIPSGPSSPFDDFDFGAAPASPVATVQSKPKAKVELGPMIQMGAIAGIVVGVIGVLFLVGWLILGRGKGPSGSVVLVGKPAPKSTSNKDAPAGMLVVADPPLDPDAGIDLSDPMLETAVDFAKAGRAGSATNALKLIDEKELETRIRGPKGSAEFVEKILKVPAVVSNLGSKSLESMILNGGTHHWKVLGKTTWNGERGVMLRYFVDSGPPKQWIETDAMFNKLAPVLEFDEFRESAGALLFPRPGDTNQFAQKLPDWPNMNHFLPPRAGFLMLIFNREGKLVDIVNPMGDLSFSRASGALYLIDYQVTVMGMRSLPKNLPSKIYPSMYGETPRYDSMGLSLGATGGDNRTLFRPNPNVPEATVPKPLSSEDAKKRTSRISDIATHFKANSPELARVIKEFRRDFPNDPGADMVIVSFSMMPIEPTASSNTTPVIDDSIKRLYDTWKDPFLLYVQWFATKNDPNAKDRDLLLQKVLESGFQTSELHQELVSRAIQSGDKASIKQSLSATVKYWAPEVKTPSTESLNIQAGKWSNIRQRIANGEKNGDGSDNGMFPRRPGRFGPLGGIASSPTPSDPVDKPSQEVNPPVRPNIEPPSSGGLGNPPPGFGQPPPGFGQPPPGFGQPPPGFGQPPPGFGSPPGSGTRSFPGMQGGPPGIKGPKVIIELTSKSFFDINVLSGALFKKLGVTNSRSSSSNNTGRMEFEFAGTLEEVEKGIDFGKIISRDEKTRTLKVEVTSGSK